MTKITTKILFTCSIFCLILQASAVAGDIFVYVNSSNTEEISLGVVRKIIQSNRLSWKNGQNVVLISEDLSNVDDEEFEEFSEISKSQYMNNWRLKFFSGRALIPIQLKKNASPIKTLNENPSSIYFTFKAISDDDLRAHQIKSLKFSY